MLTEAGQVEIPLASIKGAFFELYRSDPSGSKLTGYPLSGITLGTKVGPGGLEPGDQFLNLSQLEQQEQGRLIASTLQADEIRSRMNSYSFSNLFADNTGDLSKQLAIRNESKANHAFLEQTMVSGKVSEEVIKRVKRIEEQQKPKDSNLSDEQKITLERKRLDAAPNVLEHLPEDVSKIQGNVRVLVPDEKSSGSQKWKVKQLDIVNGEFIDPETKGKRGGFLSNDGRIALANEKTGEVKACDMKELAGALWHLKFPDADNKDGKDIKTITADWASLGRKAGMVSKKNIIDQAEAEHHFTFLMYRQSNGEDKIHDTTPSQHRQEKFHAHVDQIFKNGFTNDEELKAGLAYLMEGPGKHVRAMAQVEAELAKNEGTVPLPPLEKASLANGQAIINSQTLALDKGKLYELNTNDIHSMSTPPLSDSKDKSEHGKYFGELLPEYKVKLANGQTMDLRQQTRVVMQFTLGDDHKYRVVGSAQANNGEQPLPLTNVAELYPQANKNESQGLKTENDYLGNRSYLTGSMTEYMINPNASKSYLLSPESKELELERNRVVHDLEGLFANNFDKLSNKQVDTALLQCQWHLRNMGAQVAQADNLTRTGMEIQEQVNNGIAMTAITVATAGTGAIVTGLSGVAKIAALGRVGQVGLQALRLAGSSLGGGIASSITRASDRSSTSGNFVSGMIEGATIETAGLFSKGVGSVKQAQEVLGLAAPKADATLAEIAKYYTARKAVENSLTGKILTSGADKVKSKLLALGTQATHEVISAASQGAAFTYAGAERRGQSAEEVLTPDVVAASTGTQLVGNIVSSYIAPMFKTPLVRAYVAGSANNFSSSSLDGLSGAKTRDNERIKRGEQASRDWAAIGLDAARSGAAGSWFTPLTVGVHHITEKTGENNHTDLTKLHEALTEHSKRHPQARTGEPTVVEPTTVPEPKRTKDPVPYSGTEPTKSDQQAEELKQRTAVRRTAIPEGEHTTTHLEHLNPELGESNPVTNNPNLNSHHDPTEESASSKSDTSSLASRLRLGSRHEESSSSRGGPSSANKIDEVTFAREIGKLDNQEWVSRVRDSAANKLPLDVQLSLCQLTQEHMLAYKNGHLTDYNLQPAFSPETCNDIREIPACLNAWELCSSIPQKLAARIGAMKPLDRLAAVSAWKETIREHGVEPTLETYNRDNHNKSGNDVDKSLDRLGRFTSREKRQDNIVNQSELVRNAQGYLDEANQSNLDNQSLFEQSIRKTFESKLENLRQLSQRDDAGKHAALRRMYLEFSYSDLHLSDEDYYSNRERYDDPDYYPKSLTEAVRTNFLKLAFPELFTQTLTGDHANTNNVAEYLLTINPNDTIAVVQALRAAKPNIVHDAQDKHDEPSLPQHDDRGSHKFSSTQEFYKFLADNNLLHTLHNNTLLLQSITPDSVNSISNEQWDKFSWNQIVAICASEGNARAITDNTFLALARRKEGLSDSCVAELASKPERYKLLAENDLLHSLPEHTPYSLSGYVPWEIPPDVVRSISPEQWNKFESHHINSIFANKTNAQAIPADVVLALAGLQSNYGRPLLQSLNDDSANNLMSVPGRYKLFAEHNLLHSLPEEALKGITPDTLRLISNEDWNKFNSYDLNSIFANKANAHAITNDLVLALARRQGGPNGGSLLGGLGNESAENFISKRGRYNLLAENNLLDSLPAAAFNDITPDVVRSISGQQWSKLEPFQINHIFEVKAANAQVISDDVFLSLARRQNSAGGPLLKTLGEIATSNLMSVSGRYELLAKHDLLHSLSADGINRITPDTVRLIPDKEWDKFEPGQINSIFADKANAQAVNNNVVLALAERRDGAGKPVLQGLESRSVENFMSIPERHELLAKHYLLHSLSTTGLNRIPPDAVRLISGEEWNKFEPGQISSIFTNKANAQAVNNNVVLALAQRRDGAGKPVLKGLGITSESNLMSVPGRYKLLAEHNLLYSLSTGTLEEMTPDDVRSISREQVNKFDLDQVKGLVGKKTNAQAISDSVVLALAEQRDSKGKPFLQGLTNSASSNLMSVPGRYKLLAEHNLLVSLPNAALRGITPDAVRLISGQEWNKFEPGQINSIFTDKANAQAVTENVILALAKRRDNTGLTILQTLEKPSLDNLMSVPGRYKLLAENNLLHSLRGDVLRGVPSDIISSIPDKNWDKFSFSQIGAIFATEANAHAITDDSFLALARLVGPPNGRPLLKDVGDSAKNLMSVPGRYKLLTEHNLLHSLPANSFSKITSDIVRSISDKQWNELDSYQLNHIFAKVANAEAIDDNRFLALVGRRDSSGKSLLHLFGYDSVNSLMSVPGRYELLAKHDLLHSLPGLSVIPSDIIGSISDKDWNQFSSLQINSLFANKAHAQIIADRVILALAERRDSDGKPLLQGLRPDSANNFMSVEGRYNLLAKQNLLHSLPDISLKGITPNNAHIISGEQWNNFNSHQRLQILDNLGNADNLPGQFKAWRLCPVMPYQLATKVGNMKPLEQLAAAAAWQQTLREHHEHPSSQDTQKSFQEKFDSLNNLTVGGRRGRNNAIKETWQEFNVDVTISGHDLITKDFVRKNFLNLVTSELYAQAFNGNHNVHDALVQSLLNVKPADVPGILQSLKPDVFRNALTTLTGNQAPEQWQPDSALKLSLVFGNKWRDWLNSQTIGQGRSMHDATYWLPVRVDKVNDNSLDQVVSQNGHAPAKAASVESNVSRESNVSNIQPDSAENLAAIQEPKEPTARRDRSRAAAMKTVTADFVSKITDEQWNQIDINQLDHILSKRDTARAISDSGIVALAGRLDDSGNSLLKSLSPSAAVNLMFVQGRYKLLSDHNLLHNLPAAAFKTIVPDVVSKITNEQWNKFDVDQLNYICAKKYNTQAISESGLLTLAQRDDSAGKLLLKGLSPDSAVNIISVEAHSKLLSDHNLLQNLPDVTLSIALKEMTPDAVDKLTDEQWNKFESAQFNAIFSKEDNARAISENKLLALAQRRDSSGNPLLKGLSPDAIMNLMSAPEHYQLVAQHNLLHILPDVALKSIASALVGKLSSEQWNKFELSQVASILSKRIMQQL